MVREPRVRIVTSRAQGDARLAVTRGLITRVIGAEGCALQTDAGDLEAALNDTSVDVVVVIGGTGSGREDSSVHTLAQCGRVEAHGIALAPGQSAALGLVENRPVLLVPGRLDSALAVWLTLGRFLLGRLSATREPERTTRVAAHAQNRVGTRDCGSRAGTLPRRQGRPHRIGLSAGRGARAGRRMDLVPAQTAKDIRRGARS